MIIVTSLSEPHICVMYVNSVSPYVHNTIIYKCSANSQSILQLLIAALKKRYLHCFCINKHAMTNKLNKQTFCLAPRYANCYVMLTETFSMFYRIVCI